MRVASQKDGDLSTYFGIIDESEAGIESSSLKQKLIVNHTESNRGIIRGHLPLEYVFGFCKSCRKITKSIGFEIDLRTSNTKQDILFTTLRGNDVNVTINSISLYIYHLSSPILKHRCFLTKLLKNPSHYHMNLGRLTENQLIQLRKFK